MPDIKSDIPALLTGWLYITHINYTCIIHKRGFSINMEIWPVVSRSKLKCELVGILTEKA